MFRRIFFLILLLWLWLAGGVLLEACRAPALPPTLVPPTATAVPQTRSAVWLWTDSRLGAVDTTTGALLNQTDAVIGEIVSTRDKRRQFAVTWAQPETTSNLYLTTIDLAQGATSRVLLGTVQAGVPTIYESVSATALVSRDERTVYAAVTHQIKGNWRTDLYRIDLDTRQPSPATTVFDSPAPWVPGVNLDQTPDGKQILLARSGNHGTAQDRRYSTEVAVIDGGTLQTARTFNLPGETKVDSVWANIQPSSDGSSIYVFEHIWRNADTFELRFSSFDAETGQLQLSFLNPRGAPDTGCGLRFYRVPNGRELWNWCGLNVQFLDPETGKFTDRVDLQNPMRGGSFADYVLSRDGKTLYTVYPIERQVVVFDLDTRKILRETTLPEQSSLPDFSRTLAQLFVNRASAKLLARPIMTLAPDESWLAFVDARDFETFDGIRVVETATLKPRAHLLRRKQVAGVRASFDGGSIYTLVPNSNQMHSLNSTTGELERTVQLPFLSNSGFLADVQP